MRCFLTCLFLLSPMLADEYTFSFEELANMTISSVTAQETELKNTPAAVYVITAVDIKKGGFQSIPEALRMVPGLQVSRINANIWSIGSRGFSGRFNEKMLVMIDGRSVYSTFFAGVFWELQDVVLEDIERIEVIRGPGATLWGANAVNGVINVITKKAEDTLGSYLKVVGGTEHQGLGTLRYGDNFNDEVFYRLYMKYRNMDNTKTHSGADRPDDWDLLQGGFRIDWEINPFTTELTLQADISNSNRVGSAYTLVDDSPKPFPASLFPALANPGIVAIEDQYVNNYNFILGFKHEFSPQHRIALQTYFDSTERHTPIGEDKRRTYDADFKHFWTISKRQQFAWGLALRAVDDSIKSTATFIAEPEATLFTTASGFAEYTVHLIEDKLILTAGSKLENNSYTGFEYQPSARLRYHINENDMVWASFSRVVRTPSRFEDSGILAQALLVSPATLPFYSALEFRGHSKVVSEILYAYELGFRSQPSENINFDLTLFYNKYSKLESEELDLSSVADLTNPNIFNANNDGSADTYGIEAAINWQATERWRLRSSYTLFRDDLDGPQDFRNGSAPKNAFNLHSHYSLLDNLSLHANAYYKDNMVFYNISHYTRVDAGVIWEIREGMEFSVWGQNLLEPSHLESESSNDLFDTGNSFIGRSFFAQFTYKF